MSRFQKHFALGDRRKFAEQHGDIIQWDQSNRAHILTHGVSGVDWKHYKQRSPKMFTTSTYILAEMLTSEAE
jgi:hypothetical protein